MLFHTISRLLVGGRQLATYLRLNVFAVKGIPPYTNCLVYCCVFAHVMGENCNKKLMLSVNIVIHYKVVTFVYLKTVIPGMRVVLAGVAVNVLTVT